MYSPTTDKTYTTCALNFCHPHVYRFGYGLPFLVIKLYTALFPINFNLCTLRCSSKCYSLKSDCVPFEKQGWKLVLKRLLDQN